MKITPSRSRPVPVSAPVSRLTLLLVTLTVHVGLGVKCPSATTDGDGPSQLASMWRHGCGATSLAHLTPRPTWDDRSGHNKQRSLKRVRWTGTGLLLTGVIFMDLILSLVAEERHRTIWYSLDGRAYREATQGF